MEVAVAGVPEGPDAHVVPPADLLDDDQHFRDAAARDADVLHLHGPEALQRLVGEPAGLTKQIAFGRIGRADEHRGAGLLAREHGTVELHVGGRRRQVRFDQQHRRRVAVETQVMPVLDGTRS